MKRLIILSLAALLLLCGCSKTDSDNKQNTEKQTVVKDAVITEEGIQDLAKGGFDDSKLPELGGYIDEGNGLLYIDYEDALRTWAYGEKEVVLSDGTKGRSVIKLPILNVELEGALECSKEMAQELYSVYGSHLTDSDDRIINMDFTAEDVRDFIIVTVTAHIKESGRSYDVVHTYYYDAISDAVVSLIEFIYMNGYQFSDVYSAIIETDWAQECKESTGKYPYEDVITALTYDGEGNFEVYCTNADGKTQTKLSVKPEKTELNFEDFTVMQ